MTRSGHENISNFTSFSPYSHVPSFSVPFRQLFIIILFYVFLVLSCRQHCPCPPEDNIIRQEWLILILAKPKFQIDPLFSNTCLFSSNMDTSFLCRLQIVTGCLSNLIFCMFYCRTSVLCRSVSCNCQHSSIYYRQPLLQ